MIDELHDLACTFVVQAGEMVRAGRVGGVAVTDTKSSTTDMVTEFDRASEALIVEAIRSARPGDGIIGEEGTSSASTTGVHWAIDPIDGTTNFLYGLPGYAVSIAASDADGALVGAVFVPSSGELFSARRGGGATLNGQPIRCGTRADATTALVGTGFSYQPERRAHQGARVARMLPFVRDIRRLGAAAVDLCYVAAGRLDAYFEEGLGIWDLAAAGHLIALEAGCGSGDFGGGPARPAEVLVANPALFEQLLALIVVSSEDPSSQVTGQQGA